MLKKAIILVLLWLLWVPGAAFAQSSLRLPDVEVDLWPEFDRPSMLVIYRVTLSAQTTLPVDINLRIPAAAGAPNAVAALQADGTLVNINYQQQASGDWSVLAIKAITPVVQVEYYDPGLTKSGQARHFEYHWPGDYTVDKLTIQVQEPLGATNMQIAPDLGAGAAGADGLVYYQRELGSFSAGQSFSLTIDYQKSNDDLSSQSLPIEPSGPLASSTSARSAMLSVLPWVLGALGVLLLAGGGFWYWRSGQGIVEVNRSPRSRHKPAAAPADAGAEVYCHQCGKRASPGDRFCRACGTELRLG